jgi:hypothetical protein
VGVLVGLQVLGIGRTTTRGADAAPPTVPTVAAPDAGALGSATGPDALTEAETPPVGPLEQEPRPAPPVLLRIPSIEVTSTVVAVGLEPDGAMEIPSDVRTVGWYDPFAGAGLAPGEPGTAVIAGHVDSRTQGRGAFWLLRDLVPGDIVEVLHADDTVSVWRIEEVVRYPKTDIPIADIFTFDGPSRLALITCGGEFDRSSGSYLDNYVVTAVPSMSVPGSPVLPGAPTLPGAPALSPSPVS